MFNAIRGVAVRLGKRYISNDLGYFASVGWWTSINLIITSVISLGLAIVFAHRLAPEVYGTYQYLLSLSALVAAISLSSMSESVTQAVARGYEGTLKAAMRISLRWALVPAALAFAGAMYYVIRGTYDIAGGLAIVALCTPALGAFNSYSGFLQGKRMFRQAFYASIGVTGVYAIAVLTAVWFVPNVVALVAANIGINALAAYIGYRVVVARYHPNDQTDPKALSYGAHLSVKSAFGTVLTQMGAVLVFHFLGAADLAIFSFATLLPERTAGFFNSIGTALLPRFANQTLIDITASLWSKLWRVALLGALIAGVYALAAPYIFHYLFPRYMVAVPYTQWYALFIVLEALRNVAHAPLYSHRQMAAIYSIGFSQPVLLAVLQIPLLLTFGIMGMIAARLVSDAVGIVLALVLTFRTKRYA